MNNEAKNKGHISYAVIAIIMAGAFMSMFNETMFSVGLPTIMKSLNIETSTAQWLTTSYMLINGIFIPTTAFLLQKYSIRKLFLAAMIIFTFGTLVAGFSSTFSVLITARMVQASGAAIMMPLLMNAVLTGFPVEKRGMAMGLVGIVFMVAPATGPTISGLILKSYDWEMLFLIVAPLAIITLTLGFFILKEEAKEQKVLKIDMLSLVLSSIGFGGLLFGLSSASDGWGELKVYGTLIVAVIALVLLILRQLSLEEPMLNFRVYKYPMFALSSAISACISMAMFAAMMLIPIYVQTILGYSTLQSGLLMLPGSLLMAVLMPINGKLFDKYGGKYLSIIGLLIVILTNWFYTKLTLDTSYSYLVWLYTLRMAGMSMVMMPVTTNGLNQLPKRYYPHGTAMNSTIQQVAGSLGIALLVTVMTNRTATHVASLMKERAQELATNPALAKQLQLQGWTEGINDAFVAAMIIAIIALFLSFFMKRSKESPDPLLETAKIKKSNA